MVEENRSKADQQIVHHVTRAIRRYTSDTQAVPPEFSHLEEQLHTWKNGELHVVSSKWDPRPTESLITSAQIVWSRPDTDPMEDPSLVMRVRTKNTNEGAIAYAQDTGGNLTRAFDSGVLDFQLRFFPSQTAVEVGLSVRRTRASKSDSTSTYPADIAKIQFVRKEGDEGKVTVMGQIGRDTTRIPDRRESGSHQDVTLVAFAEMRQHIRAMAKDAYRDPDEE